MFSVVEVQELQTYCEHQYSYVTARGKDYTKGFLVFFLSSLDSERHNIWLYRVLYKRLYNFLEIKESSWCHIRFRSVRLAFGVFKH